jgi:hypothetical protein
VNDHSASIGVPRGQHIESPAVVGFIDRNYRYKSVPTQISHDIGLAPIPYNGRKSTTQGIEPTPPQIVRVESSTP